MPLELGLVFIVTAILFICFSLKKVGKGQSLVVFQNGRAVKAIERNGLTLLLPFVQTAKLIDVRKTSLAIPAVYSDIDSRTPLVKGKFEYQIFDACRAAGVVNLPGEVEIAVVSALQRTLVDATLAQCMHGSGELERWILENANLKLAGRGVKLTAVNVDAFLLHRQLLIQITTLPYIVYWQIVEEVQ